MGWMLNWFTFLGTTASYGKCLVRSPGFDSISATNFDSGKENHLLRRRRLTLSHWGSHWRSLGTWNFYLSCRQGGWILLLSEEWQRVPVAEALSWSNWISMEVSIFSVALFYLTIFLLLLLKIFDNISGTFCISSNKYFMRYLNSLVKR